MNELLEALEDAPNVNKLTYDVKLKKWIVQYNNLSSNTVTSNILIEFIKNV